MRVSRPPAFVETPCDEPWPPTNQPARNILERVVTTNGIQYINESSTMLPEDIDAANEAHRMSFWRENPYKPIFSPIDGRRLPRLSTAERRSAWRALEEDGHKIEAAAIKEIRQYWKVITSNFHNRCVEAYHCGLVDGGLERATTDRVGYQVTPLTPTPLPNQHNAWSGIYERPARVLMLKIFTERFNSSGTYIHPDPNGRDPSSLYLSTNSPGCNV